MSTESFTPSKPVLAAAFMIVVVVGVAAIYEVGLARPLGLKFYAVAGTLCVFLSTFILRRQPVVLQVGLPVALLISLATLHLVPWSSRKAFLTSLGAVAEGMTPGEVEMVLGQYLRVSGSPGEGPTVYRHSTEGRFDSDFGVVHYQQGRVSKVEFLPD